MKGKHQRTRAILWCLMDVDPDMPLATALGHLKAIEARLAAMDAAREREKIKRQAARAHAAATPTAADLIRDYAGKPAVKALVASGKTGILIDRLVRETGASRDDAMAAAISMEAILGGPPEAPPF